MQRIPLILKETNAIYANLNNQTETIFIRNSSGGGSEATNSVAGAGVMAAGSGRLAVYITTVFGVTEDLPCPRYTRGR